MIEEDLKSTLSLMANAIFAQNLKSKWVDAYFPFTHPSWELEIYFAEKWMEVLGSGIYLFGYFLNRKRSHSARNFKQLWIK